MTERHGPQIVVWRARREGEEIVHRTDDFEAAGRLWREGQRRMCGPGGYSVWINDGDLWRSSGLLEDRPAALAIRDRIMAKEFP